MIYLVDASRYQGHVDWHAVSEHEKPEIVGAICRATIGNGGKDEEFASNYLNIASAGLIRGTYHAADPEENRIADAFGEADALCDAIVEGGGLRRGDLPPALDIEVRRDLGGGIRAIGVGNVFTTWVRKWCERIEDRLDIQPMIYTGGPFFDASTAGASGEDLDAIAQYDLWLAAYVQPQAVTRYIPNAWKRVGRSWTFWQQSGDSAAPGDTVLRIGKTVFDKSIFNGTRDELIAFCDDRRIMHHPSMDEKPTEFQPQTDPFAAGVSAEQLFPETKNDDDRSDKS